MLIWNGALLLHQDSEAAPVFIRPPMKDKEAWTGAPEYERSLHVRVYKPEGLDYRELKCKLTYGKQVHTTGLLDVQEVSSLPSIVKEIYRNTNPRLQLVINAS